ncbi:MAG: DUF6364 family protein [Bacteroidia bacterium]
MKTKLTISLNKDVVLLAKKYAKQHNVSLSFLVEKYLLKIVSEFQSTTDSKASIVNELSGIISLESDYDYKKDYTDYLNEK